MKRFGWIALLVVSALAVGCEEKKEEGAGTTGSTAAPVALTEKDLPTPADFDDEAEKQITSANYKSELDTLDKEIGRRINRLPREA